MAVLKVVDVHLAASRVDHAFDCRDLRQLRDEYPGQQLRQPPHAVASFNLAVVLEDSGQEDNALTAYHQAIAADPDCEDAYFNLSRLYERRGERAFALRALRTYRNLTRRP